MILRLTNPTHPSERSQYTAMSMCLVWRSSMAINSGQSVIADCGNESLKIVGTSYCIPVSM
jgi:hypothetical protein